MKISTAALSLFLGVCLPTVDRALPLDIPDDFLRTDSARANRVLAMKITADFREAPLREVIDVLKKQTTTGQTGLNIVLKLEPHGPVASGAPVEPPAITAQFKDTPLREVLYRLGRDAQLGIDWFYSPENSRIPWGIDIHTK